MVDLTVVKYEIWNFGNKLYCMFSSMLPILIWKFCPIHGVKASFTSCPALADYWCVSPVSCFPVYFNPPLWWSLPRLSINFVLLLVCLLCFTGLLFLFLDFCLLPPCLVAWIWSNFLYDLVPLIGSKVLHSVLCSSTWLPLITPRASLSSLHQLIKLRVLSKVNVMNKCT